jgi:hypothetical protein
MRPGAVKFMQIIPRAAILGREIYQREITLRRNKETALYALNFAAIFRRRSLAQRPNCYFCYVFSIPFPMLCDDFATSISGRKPGVFLYSSGSVVKNSG